MKKFRDNLLSYFSDYGMAASLPPPPLPTTVPLPQPQEELDLAVMKYEAEIARLRKELNEKDEEIEQIHENYSKRETVASQEKSLDKVWHIPSAFKTGIYP